MRKVIAGAAVALTVTFGGCGTGVTHHAERYPWPAKIQRELVRAKVWADAQPAARGCNAWVEAKPDQELAPWEVLAGCKR